MRWHRDRLSNMTSSSLGSSAAAALAAESTSYQPAMTSTPSRRHDDDHVIASIADELVQYVWDVSVGSGGVAVSTKVGVNGGKGKARDSSAALAAGGLRSDPEIVMAALGHQQLRAEVLIVSLFRHLQHKKIKHL